VTAKSGLAVSFYGLGAAIGDYDNDGFDDIFITAVGQSHLFHNTVTALSKMSRPRRPWGPNEFSTSAAWVDSTASGKLDLVVSNYVAMVGKRRSLLHARRGSQIVLQRRNRTKDIGTLVAQHRRRKIEDATQKTGFYDPTSKSLGVANSRLQR